MWFLKQYFGVLVGVIIGATIATVTTMVIYGDLPGIEPEDLRQCLIENSSPSS